MTYAKGAPVSYFAASEHSPWQWSQDGSVLVWFDGTTVAFREELAEIIEPLASRGFPSFGAIVLALGALKGKLPDMWWMSAQDEATKMRAGRALDAIADVTSLSRDDLPALGTTKGKAVLVDVLFESEPTVVTSEEASALLNELSGAAAEGELWALAASRDETRILRDVETLARGWQAFDPAAFELRLRTGLDWLPVEPALDEDLIPPSERARQLLKELEADEEARGLAKLTRDLMAAIYFPHRLLPRDEAPSGGYSDVSNRGSLDRLLLSELAHDDLTLSVRVALNEALYVKREPPAEHPEGELTLLLDAGLRLWGVPRVFATAVALALIAVQRGKRAVSIYRAEGARVEKVGFLTREALTEHLERLEPELGPTRAIGSFVETLSKKPGSEGVIVTEADTLEDAEFRAELRRFDLGALYLASVNRAGSFRLFSYPHFDAKPLSSAVLDLKSIAPERAQAAPDVTAPLLEPGYDPELPVILAVRPFPFLLPVRGRVEIVTNLPTGEGACATRDGRVLLWTGRGLGARVVASGLPSGQPKLLFLGDERILLVRERRQSLRVSTIERESGDVATIVVDLDASPHEVLHEDGVLVLVHTGYAEAIDPRTGRQLASCKPLGAFHRGFVEGEPWRRLSWDGIALDLPSVDVAHVDPRDVLHVFDWVGHEGPLVLVRNEGIRAATGTVLLHGDVSGLSGIAEDGSRVTARATDGSHLLFDLPRQKVSRVAEYELSWLEAKSQYVPARSLRSRIVHVSASRRGGLVIGTARGDYLELVAREGELVLASSGREGHVRALKRHPVASRYGCELSVATWDDGTRVFLDSRGPLHLKSGDASLDEVSVILGEPTAAAWSSSGETVGPRFFLGGESTTTADAMIEAIRRILERVA